MNKIYSFKSLMINIADVAIIYVGNIGIINRSFSTSLQTE